MVRARGVIEGETGRGLASASACWRRAACEALACSKSSSEACCAVRERLAIVVDLGLMRGVSGAERCDSGRGGTTMSAHAFQGGTGGRGEEGRTSSSSSFVLFRRSRRWARAATHSRERSPIGGPHPAGRTVRDRSGTSEDSGIAVWVGRREGG